MMPWNMRRSDLVEALRMRAYMLVVFTLYLFSACVCVCVCSRAHACADAGIWQSEDNSVGVGSLLPPKLRLLGLETC